MPRQFSQSDNEMILEMRENGASWRKIRTSFGVGYKLMKKHIDTDPYFDHVRNEIFWTSPSPHAESKDDRIVELLRAGKTTLEIAFDLGMQRSATQKRIDRGGLKERAGLTRGKGHGRLSAENLATIESYLKEGYSYKQTALITGHGQREISKHFPKYIDNGRVAQSMRMTEYHMYKKIDEVWGLKNAA